MQIKFLFVKMSTKIKKKSIAPLLMFFSIFNINYCYAVAVGEFYGGGTVFCVSQTPDITQCVPIGSGNYGLIMANEDQANYDSNPEHGVTWSNNYSEIGGARSYDNGAANTAAIIAALPEDNLGNNAAWLCHNYRDQIKRYEDWYLPSKNELNKMYVYAHANNLIGRGCAGSKVGGVQCLVGGYDAYGDYDDYNDDNKYYWSSTEYSGCHGSASWGQFFSNDLQSYDNKVSIYAGVRAIRAFNNLPIQQFNNLSLKGYPVIEALVVMDKRLNGNIEHLRFAFGY